MGWKAMIVSLAQMGIELLIKTPKLKLIGCLFYALAMLLLLRGRILDAAGAALIGAAVVFTSVAIKSDTLP